MEMLKTASETNRFTSKKRTWTFIGVADSHNMVTCWPKLHYIIYIMYKYMISCRQSTTSSNKNPTSHIFIMPKLHQETFTENLMHRLPGLDCTRQWDPKASRSMWWCGMINAFFEETQNSCTHLDGVKWLEPQFLLSDLFILNFQYRWVIQPVSLNPNSTTKTPLDVHNVWISKYILMHFIKKESQRYKREVNRLRTKLQKQALSSNWLSEKSPNISKWSDFFH